MTLNEIFEAFEDYNVDLNVTESNALSDAFHPPQVKWLEENPPPKYLPPPPQRDNQTYPTKCCRKGKKGCLNSELNTSSASNFKPHSLALATGRS